MTKTVKTKKRASGILVHPTSFPSAFGIGDLGYSAYLFIDFLEKSGQTLWQLLPLGPTDVEGSPYQAFSSFAGQELLISPELLKDEGLLTDEDFALMPEFDPNLVDYTMVRKYKTKLFKKAFVRFKELLEDDPQLKNDFQSFLSKEKEWLSDYSLFMALKEHFDNTSWHEWPEEVRTPDIAVKAKWRKKLEDSILYQNFLQYTFFTQWFTLKKYANGKGISIIGDIPFYVSDNSADVWAEQELFYLDEEGFPTVVAGVPPDYFSATGQLWGNPVYRWANHKKQNYRWWMRRIKAQLSMCDYLRIDHFRAFQDYWEIPATEETAIKGKWVPGPRDDFFRTLQKNFGTSLPIIAEDLGIITDSVRALRDKFNLPGMKILQFAFDQNPGNDYLPHNFTTTNCVCYSGTHDNDTTVGWYQSAPEASKDEVRCYMNTDGNNVHWDFIRCCFGSVANMAIVPIQDLFGQDSRYRMNVPGVANGNWSYRFEEQQLNDGLAEYLHFINLLYGR